MAQFLTEWIEWKNGMEEKVQWAGLDPGSGHNKIPVEWDLTSMDFKIGLYVLINGNVTILFWLGFQRQIKCWVLLKTTWLFHF